MIRAAPHHYEPAHPEVAMKQKVNRRYKIESEHESPGDVLANKSSHISGDAFVKLAFKLYLICTWSEQVAETVLQRVVGSNEVPKVWITSVVLLS